MSVPKNYGYLRTGLASIADHDEAANENYLFDVQMKKASSLLSSLPEINYIKCDIEGYEEYVLPEIKEILAKHKPILQIETWGAHKKVVDDLMLELGYEKYNLQGGKLLKIGSHDNAYGDYIFIYPRETS